MSGHSENEWADLRNRVLGLGDESLHKSLYPTLRQRVAELERFRSLVDASSDLLFIVEVPSGQIIYANEEARSNLGLAGIGADAPSFRELIAPAGWTRLSELWESPAVEEGTVIVSELGRLEGKSIPVEIAVRVSTSTGKRHGVLAARNIEDRVQAEREQARLEEQLRQAQKLESVGRLAGGVAHDFNNLLTVISGYSALLLTRLGETGDLSGYAQQITKAAESAAGLTAQLLSFSRKQMIRPSSIDLNALIAEMADMLRRLLGEDVHLVLRLDPALETVWADAGQMNQVLMNLCVNARDAMPRGGDLIVTTANVEGERANLDGREGRYALLTVTDTGEGMDAATLEQIFEPFFTTKQGKGTGLGLASVYGIVHQSNGWIAVSSEPGRGTTFEVYLPLAGAVEAERLPDIAAAPPLPPPSRQVTLMVVEDQDPVRRLAAAICTQAGYHVLAAASGFEALEMAAQHSGEIDLLITDVVLPRMNGREVAEQMRALRPGLKVLYTSGYTSDAILERGVVDRGVGFLPKPFTPKTLIARVRELLEG
jgi:PAS domain S-box-containing protein